MYNTRKKSEREHDDPKLVTAKCHTLLPSDGKGAFEETLFALQIVPGTAASVNKHDHDVTNGIVLCHNCALSTLFLPVVYW